MNRKQDAIIAMAAIATIVIMVLYCIASEATVKTGVREYIAHYLRDAPTARQVDGMAMATHVEQAATRYKIDPMMLAVTIALESSFTTKVTGGKREIGLTQIMPRGVCAKGQNLTTEQGQIFAGAFCFSLGKMQCGNDPHALFSVYMSGKCKPRTKRTERMVNYRLNKYNKARERFK